MRLRFLCILKLYKLRYVEVVHEATPVEGEKCDVFILCLYKAVDIPGQEPTRIHLNHLHHNYGKVDDCPKHLYPQVTHSLHYIRFPYHDILFPLQIYGVI